MTTTRRKRNRQSAKNAGARFERTIADYLADTIDDRIDRRVKAGAKDKGDIAGLRVHGERITIECKDYGGQLKPGTWVEEVHTEMGNDEAIAGIVIAKRRGTTDPGSQWAVMTVNDLIALITGDRHDTDL